MRRLCCAELNQFSRLNIDGLFIIKLNYHMYKEPRIKTSPVAFILVLFLVVSLFVSEGMLLCFGKDGHVAIELVDACNCSDFGLQLSDIEGDACGPCKDILLQSSPRFTNRTVYCTDTQTLPLIYSSLFTPSPSSKEQYCSSVSLPEKPHNKTLANLQPIVLLI